MVPESKHRLMMLFMLLARCGVNGVDAWSYDLNRQVNKAMTNEWYRTWVVRGYIHDEEGK